MSKMLTRRQLLSRGTTLLLLVPVIPAVLQACSSSSSPSSGSGDDTGSQTCDGSDTVSTVNEGHTHSMCVPTTDMTSPPAAGATYTSSNDGEHTHTIVLTAAQLASIQSGTSVTVTSSSDVDPTNNTAHTHDWTISKAATGNPTPPPPSGW